MRLRNIQAIALAVAGLLFQATCLSGLTTGSRAYDRLAASRDALLAQQRDIQRAYDDLARQMDEIKRKMTLLDAYAHQTDNAIRDVDRAMAATQ